MKSLGARACTSFCSSTSRQPRPGALSTIPLLFPIWPCTPSPKALISAKGIPAAPQAVLAARTTASTTCGGSLLTRRCLSSPRMRPSGSRTLLAPTSTPTVKSSRDRTRAQYQAESSRRTSSTTPSTSFWSSRSPASLSDS